MLEFIKSLDMLHQVLISLWLGFGVMLCIPNYFKALLCTLALVDGSYSQNLTGKLTDIMWLVLTIYLGITVF